MSRTTLPCTEVSREVAEALTEAFRGAIRREQPAVGTEHVLSALLDGDSAAGKVLAPTVRASGSMMGVIRAKGIGDHWVHDEDAEPVHDLAVTGLLREAEWAARQKDSDVPPPTGALRAALRQALLYADEHGTPRANTAHLLMGLLHSPQNRAHEALRECRVDRSDVLARLQVHPSAREPGEPPRTDTARTLRKMGLLTGRRGQLSVRLVAKLFGNGAPVFMVLRPEARRQAIRLGHGEVTTAHLLLAVLALDEQLTAAGERFSPELAGSSTAAERLRTRGVTLHAAASAALDLVPAAENRPRAGEFPENGALLKVLTKARWRAEENGVPAGTDVLLAELLAEPDGLAGALLTGLGVDTDDLV
ncbi:Clp amino terminal domain-containing protein, pathogenicity island component [Saccharopolyspora antimicrobica]|uniref:Clp amino terminal domain-containing protein, pathogenicity island component n=1 Tax=Saccharopolyspora antimicrobica TaxID=455193 RepID=A0A1I5C789_9PSEU|nr:Clp protease N-terminal domain-containing protein [Saccharopolyspora antimicrobica]RKT88946.1 ClpA/ClpB-like protein [Saccharopolyspora antimicrobica]SFN82885.1 Clp amino terminal domain-containing protein, pathogenicity island component [Saccharopolyspora antimicrobica]